MYIFLYTNYKDMFDFSDIHIASPDTLWLGSLYVFSSPYLFARGWFSRYRHYEQ